ncbi:MAG: hypothetical protein JWM10_1622, partial [Myxococcaceae bacterium]|nr:hypothetical protein [Myxococcaceae bacterium]
LRWDGDGVTVQTRVERDAAPNAWSAWSAPTAERTIALGDGVRRVQAMAVFTGDGTATPALRSVALDCAP